MTEPVPLTGDDVAEPELGAEERLDRINLEQALRDFEVANRRVIDLTQRLTSIHRELIDARSALQFSNLELQSTRAELARLRADLIGLQSSNSYKVARVLAHARASVRR
jgi:hypothetical protein